MKFETNVWIDAADVNRLTKVSNLNLRKWFDEKYGDEARIQSFTWAAFIEVGAKEVIDFIKQYAIVDVFDEGGGMREITAESINKIAELLPAGGDFHSESVASFEVEREMLNFTADNQAVTLGAKDSAVSLQGRNSGIDLCSSENTIVVLSGTGQHLKGNEGAFDNLVICTGNANTIECNDSCVILTGTGNEVTGVNNTIISFGERDRINVDGEHSEVFLNSDHSLINFNGGKTYFYTAQPASLSRAGTPFGAPALDEDGNLVHARNGYRYEYDSQELYMSE